MAGKIFRENKWFFIPYLIFLVFGLLINISYSQKDIFFYINGYNTTYLDWGMQYYTWIGDGIAATILVFILALIKLRYGIISAVALLSQGIIAQLLKRFVFENYYRPWKLWGNAEDFYVIPGFEPHEYNSMPSGHTSTAFAAFLLIAMFFKYPNLKWIFFIFAFSVGYSRIYLSQHMFIDTYVGSIIGVLVTVLIYMLMNPKLRNSKWADKPLINISA